MNTLKETCSKCHENFMNCYCEQFHPNTNNEKIKELIRKLTTLACKFNCDAISVCSCSAHVLYLEIMELLNDRT